MTPTPLTDLGPDPCPWVWRGRTCALGRAHPSPHQLWGEQTEFDAILRDAADRAVAEMAAWIAAAMHWSNCDAWEGRPCNCGRDELLAEPGET